jgi:HK97 family phage major capsid protein
MTITQLIAQLRATMAAKLSERNTYTEELTELRAAETTDQARVDEIRTARAALDAEIDQLEARVAELQAEQAADEVANERANTVVPGAPAPGTDRAPVTVGAEARTYRPDTDPKGLRFAADVVAAFMGDFRASERLARHTDEERVDRGLERDAEFDARAVGTGAFTGLVVPQYLVDQFAALPRADRPLADAMRHHDLPEQGMTVNIGRLTTGTSAAEQTAENQTVSETDADDTLLTLNVLTSSGSQTVSRQGSERGAGVEDTIFADLISAQRSNLDSLLINRAATGLTNVATAIAYTDATPTAAELYPKLLQAPAQVEAALLNAHPGDVMAIMHSRRWYWLNSQLTSTWPLFGQPGGAGVQNAGANYGERYGNGFRGILPNGTPVIVDNNISTTLGAGTEDEIYFSSQIESHLWEDPNAPVLIRAEQPSAKKLGIDLVVYAYFAYTFGRLTHAQKVNGTGLIAPTF